MYSIQHVGVCISSLLRYNTWVLMAICYTKYIALHVVVYMVQTQFCNMNHSCYDKWPTFMDLSVTRLNESYGCNYGSMNPGWPPERSVTRNLGAFARRFQWNRSSGDTGIYSLLDHVRVTGDCVGLCTRPEHAQDGDIQCSGSHPGFIEP